VKDKIYKRIDIDKFRSEVYSKKLNYDTLFESFFYLTSINALNVNYRTPSEQIQISIDKALEYPKLLTNNIQKYDKYFKENKSRFERILKKDYCEELKAIKNLADDDIALYVCNNFVSKTAKEGILSFWYFTIYHIQLMTTELNGVQASDFNDAKLSYWRSSEFYQIRMAHYELNKYFVDILEEFFKKTSDELNTEIYNFFLTFWIGFSIVTLFINLAFLSNTSAELTNDMKICRETFRIIEMRIIIWNPYILNRVKKFFEFGKIQKG